MMKIGIEIPDEHFNNVDLSHPEKGNPGVGGSEYLFALLAKELSERDLDITVFHYSGNIIPSKVKNVISNSYIDMIDKANQIGIDILIHQVGKAEEWYNSLKKSNIKSVAWAHVYLDYLELKLLRKCNNVKRVVFVSKEEYDAYIDDDVIEKSDYIFNMIPTGMVSERKSSRNPVVTYVGSLVPAKGFHKLAEIWPDVLRKVPDAELNVIGNGKVYNRNAKLGKYGISQEDYEDSFMKYLVDDKGEILSSVHFLGIVGAEKRDIFRDTAVGVVNPTALTETFCMSAVEMEYAYIPVISKGKWGLLDTIDDGRTGYLFKCKKQFIKYIVTLLNESLHNNDMGTNAHEFVKTHFSTSVIIPKWIELLNAVSVNQPAIYHPPYKNWSNDYKYIKILLRFLRFDIKMRFFPSFGDVKYSIKKMVGK